MLRTRLKRLLGIRSPSRDLVDAIKPKHARDHNEPFEDLVWQCHLRVQIPRFMLPHGSDGPMRAAVEKACFELTGFDPTDIFSGWNGSLNLMQRVVVENRDMTPEEYAEWEIVRKVIDAHPSVYPDLVTPK